MNRRIVATYGIREFVRADVLSDGAPEAWLF
jgi:hypothetical protein